MIVDEDTQFVSLLMRRDALPPGATLPEPLMRWTAGALRRRQRARRGRPRLDRASRAEPPLASAAVFRDVPGWRLREVPPVGDLKISGNAQSVAKDRFVHHTSFLWGFDPRRMRYLRNPEKQPRYRGGGTTTRS